MPYAWFMAMEVPDPASQVLFREPANLDRYGYIPAPQSARNPDALPIGFAKDVGKNGDEHLGLTCAACHTGKLIVAGRPVIVEGGQGLSDFEPFLADAVTALAASLNDTAKFDRFAGRVLNTSSPSAADQEALRAQMTVKLRDLQTRISQNSPDNPGGNGRVDAFGHIFTRVLAQVLNIPENAAPPYGPRLSAPVSYPYLWDTPQHDVVQWNGSAPNTRFLSLGPTGRNVGELLGVFGDLEVTPGRNIPFLPFLSKPPSAVSSVHLTNIIRLENLVTTLWSPAWPTSCLPLAPKPVLDRGREVYTANCASCHRLMAPGERKDPRRKIEAVLKTLPEVTTDPTMAMNFAARRAKTGPFAGKPDVVSLEIFGAESIARDVLLAAVNKVMLTGGVPVDPSSLWVNPADEVRVMQKALAAAKTPRYKARPLNGIWATAPYLHNGSVPTLYDLLNPTSCSPTVTECRPSEFYVGSRDFDPVKVGLVTSHVPGAFRFDTSPQGNWRNGHDYGTTLPKADKEALLEFLKTL
jgi:cytochrome c5